MTGAPERRVCVGQIVGAIGVRGELRLKPFTAEPDGVAAYGPVTAEPGGVVLELEVLRVVKDGVAVRAKGIADRTTAEALKGKRLYVPRAALPAPAEDEFYHADLIGLRAEDAAGAVIGRVAAVHNFGAGDILEIERIGASPLLMPFTKATAPAVDMAAGRVVVTLSESVADEED